MTNVVPGSPEDLRAKLAWANVPDDHHEEMLGYIIHGVPPGSFIRAVLENDLREACRRADEGNRPKLFSFVAFLFNYAPMIVWGSPEAVASHIVNKRQERERAANG
jgi:hypothetical protein